MRKIHSHASAEHDNCAEDYDSLSLQLENHAHEVIFGLVFEYINEGDNLLDLGIGTGLGSSLFHKAGLNIYGLDNSNKMINICQEKNIARDLKLYDLKKSNWPYDNHEFDHVIAVGLFHFFKDLDNFFKEVQRMVKKGGTFSFTVKYSETLISVEINEEYDMEVYGHSEEYLEKLIHKYGFKLEKSMRFETFKDLSRTESLHFKAYVLRK